MSTVAEDKVIFHSILRFVSLANTYDPNVVDMITIKFSITVLPIYVIFGSEDWLALDTIKEKSCSLYCRWWSSTAYEHALMVIAFSFYELKASLFCLSWLAYFVTKQLEILKLLV